MKIKLDREDIPLLAKAIAEELRPKNTPAERHPLNDLDNWIRADDLYSRKLFSRPTLNRHHQKGVVGKSTVGGAVFYYIPDILGLLKMNYHKPEAIQQISEELKSKKLQS